MRRPESPPFQLDDPVARAEAELEWLEIGRAVAALVPRTAEGRWLGYLVIEAQKASDRAVAAAQLRADALIAEARARAVAIRTDERRRMHAAGGMWSLTHPPEAQGGRHGMPDA